MEMHWVNFNGRKVPICDECIKGTHESYGKDHRLDNSDCKNLSDDKQTQCVCDPNIKGLIKESQIRMDFKNIHSINDLIKKADYPKYMALRIGLDWGGVSYLFNDFSEIPTKVLNMIKESYVEYFLRGKEVRPWIVIENIHNRTKLELQSKLSLNGDSLLINNKEYPVVVQDLAQYFIDEGILNIKEIYESIEDKLPAPEHRKEYQEMPEENDNEV